MPEKAVNIYILLPSVCVSSLCQDMYSTQLYLAPTFRGVLLFRGSMLAETFKWDSIRKFSQDGRALIIHAVLSEVGLGNCH